MKINEALKDLCPGDIIFLGKPDDANYIEIFVLSDLSLRFSDSMMEINNEALKSDNWNNKL